MRRKQKIGKALTVLFRQGGNEYDSRGDVAILAISKEELNSVFIPICYAGVGFVAYDSVQATGVPFKALAGRNALAGEFSCDRPDAYFFVNKQIKYYSY